MNGTDRILSADEARLAQAVCVAEQFDLALRLLQRDLQTLAAMAGRTAFANAVEPNHIEVFNVATVARALAESADRVLSHISPQLDQVKATYAVQRVIANACWRAGT